MNSKCWRRKYGSVWVGKRRNTRGLISNQYIRGCDLAHFMASNVNNIKTLYSVLFTTMKATFPSCHVSWIRNKSFGWSHHSYCYTRAKCPTSMTEKHPTVAEVALDWVGHLDSIKACRFLWEGSIVSTSKSLSLCFMAFKTPG
jgi:hypothetical protein